MKDVAIVTVGYKEFLTDDEIISFERCLRVFNKRDIFMIIPDNIDLYGYEDVINNANKHVTFLKFDSNWFKSVHTYSTLLVQKSFYELFLDYKYILIYQLDCYVFKDNLNYFVDLDYDYYGAGWYWSNVFKVVGNGGLSLRKVSAFIKNIETRGDLDFINSGECENFIEDLAFCNGFWPLENICPFEIAEQFSYETTYTLRNPSEMGIDDFPMGLHGFSKPEFKNGMSKFIGRWDELNINNNDSQNVKKTIVIHFYIKNNLDYFKCLNLHFYYYEKYASLFDDVIFVIVPENMQDTYFISLIIGKANSVFKNNNLMIKVVNNDPLHEALTFYNEVLTNDKLNGLVFFCHSKGGRFLVENTFKWVSCMYYYNLNYIDDVIDKIYRKDGIFYGSFLHYSDEKEVFNKNSAWYAGTFYWINIDRLRDYLKNNGILINQISDGFFAEKLPGELFTKEQLNTLNNVMFNCKEVDGYFGNYNEYVEKMGFADDFWREYNSMIEKISIKAH